MQEEKRIKAVHSCNTVHLSAYKCKKQLLAVKHICFSFFDYYNFNFYYYYCDELCLF